MAEGEVRVICRGSYLRTGLTTALWKGTATAWTISSVRRTGVGDRPIPPPPIDNPPPTGCEWQIIYDPETCTPPTGGPGAGGGGGGGGGGHTCQQEYVIIEISYDGGNTWSVWWEGWAQMCG